MSLHERILTDTNRISQLLKATRRVAVLGIRGESCAALPTHYVPAYLASVGLEIVPVPVYERNVTEILGRPVYRKLADIPGTIDMVDVFRRPDDIPAHIPDILALRPVAVWFQSGIRHDEVAQQLAEAGIIVVQDRCLMVDYRALAAA